MEIGHLCVGVAHSVVLIHITDGNRSSVYWCGPLCGFDPYN